RGNYVRQRAEEDVAFQQQLDDYNRAVDQNRRQNEELKQRHAQLTRDELWKQGKCRYCPKCYRVIEKLEGTDIFTSYFVN
ncbi:unnamed protein product, partial [Didymodactylos carnosus]